MAFSVRKRIRKKINIQSTTKPENHAWKQFYKYSPSGIVQLEQFEVQSFQRLILLSNIESWMGRGIRFGSIQKQGSSLEQLISESHDKYYGMVGSSEFDSVNDELGHHVLRLAHCHSPQLREWFVKYECILMQYRLKKNLDGNESLLSNLGYNVSRVTEEPEKIINQIRSLHSGKLSSSAKLFKVPFKHVLDLVKQRKVMLEAGYAYITESQLSSVILKHFEFQLRQKLATANRLLPGLQDKEKDRILPFLTQLANKSLIVGNHSTINYGNGDDVQPGQINTLKNQSFPLCMRVLHNQLKTQHHLPHVGRMEYGLFLKNIGLSLDNALKFWSDEFTHKMTQSKFDTNYAYNIRHNYGKEGRGQSYSGYGCQKILNTKGPCGGCPWKSFDKNHLRKLLQSEPNANETPLSESDINELLDYAKNKSMEQIACRKYFELTHPPFEQWPKEVLDEDRGTPFHHPNIYYKVSRKILTKKKQFSNDPDAMVDE